jgi:hypothetical protein
VTEEHSEISEADAAVAQAKKMQQSGCMGCLLVFGLMQAMPFVGLGLAAMFDVASMVFLVGGTSLLLIGTLRLRAARKAAERTD